MLISPNASTTAAPVTGTSAARPGFDFHAAPEHRELARLDYGRGLVVPVTGDVSWRGGAAHVVGSDRVVDGYDPLTRRPHNIFQRIGTSYLDALHAAQREVRSSTLADGRPAWNAAGVLRGRDGAFWITSLGITGRPAAAVRIDSPAPELPHAVRVERTSEQLLAVVGARTWQDFSGIAVDFDPARD